jgi:predicted HTH transcriptional regulator
MWWLIVGGGALLSFGLGYCLGLRRSRAANPFTTPVTGESEALQAAHEAVSERTADRLDRIVSKAQADGRITNDGVEELFCISDRTAGRYLRELVEAGRLQRQGKGRGTYYTLIEDRRTANPAI